MTPLQIARKLKTTARRLEILSEVSKGNGPGRIDLALRALMNEGMIDHNGSLHGWYITDKGRVLLDDAVQLQAAP